MDGLLELFNKLARSGLPEGSPSFKEAREVNKKERIRKSQERIADDYNIPWIRTKYGGTDSYGTLQDWFNRAQRERVYDLDRTIPTQQELEYGLPPQEPEPMLMPQEQPQQQPQVLGVSTEGKIAGSPKYTNSDEVWYWDEAPTVSGTPQRAIDFYKDYSYSGNGSFATPLSPEYIQLVWNEINQQLPGESENNKLALLETMLAVSHPESHGGWDAGGLQGRNTNVWNVGFNARPDSVLKYDPVNSAEMADRAVNSFINDFGAIENKGLTDQMIHNYHIGPKAAFNPAGVQSYREGMGGWESLYQPTYPWE